MIENRPETNSWSIWAALDLRLSKMVPKLAMWSIRGPWVQYMYRDWRARANRRRAEGCLYVWETPFTVQRALCTFRGKGHPVQRALRTFMGKGTMAPI